MTLSETLLCVVAVEALIMILLSYKMMTAFKIALADSDAKDVVRRVAQRAMAWDNSDTEVISPSEREARFHGREA